MKTQGKAITALFALMLTAKVSAFVDWDLAPLAAVGARFTTYLHQDGLSEEDKDEFYRDVHSMPFAIDNARRTMNDEDRKFAYFVQEAFQNPGKRVDWPCPEQIKKENTGCRVVRPDELEEGMLTNADNKDKYLAEEQWGLWVEDRKTWHRRWAHIPGIGWSTNVPMVTLTYRGTQAKSKATGKNEVIADGFIVTVTEDESPYHARGNNVLAAVRRWAQKTYPKGYEITVGGHSLGGSVALWATEQQRIADHKKEGESFDNHVATYAYNPGASILHKGSARRLGEHLGVSNPKNHYFFMANKAGFFGVFAGRLFGFDLGLDMRRTDVVSFCLLSCLQTKEQLERVVVKQGDSAFEKANPQNNTSGYNAIVLHNMWRWLEYGRSYLQGWDDPSADKSLQPSI